MSRVVFVHSDPSKVARERERLERAGHRVEVRAARDLAEVSARPPDVVVIDLDRAPSQGRDVGLWLRQRKATRRLPLVLVCDDRAVLERTAPLLPDAVATGRRRIVDAVGRALRRPPTRPVASGVLSGYSGTPLVRKLGVKAGTRLLLLGAPHDFEATLGPLPEGATVSRRARGAADRVMLFCDSTSSLMRRFRAAERCVAEGGGLWIAWPKQSSGVRTDLTQSAVRAHGLDSGWVDYKICAIDETWSGLLFARRRAEGGSRR